ncbi:MAG TPA: hypothetical protein VHZ98_05930 [Galbitalea sp.]|jgi:hypothetical protein|nr:hypothetical protein [Galbitalea sp.]
MQHYLGSIIMGAIVAAVLIGACVYLLLRTPKRRGDARVVGAPLAGDEPTEHERELALENLITMNQVGALRQNGQFPG